MSSDLVAQGSMILEKNWVLINSLAQKSKLKDTVRGKLLVSIRNSVNATIKSYRYVLPTQIVAKLADSKLDCKCLQASRGGQGSFDARTIAHKVLVPFDQNNQSVLGGSPEPYVNNPLRVSEVSSKHQGAQKKPKEWNHLCSVLAYVEEVNSPKVTKAIFTQVLIEVYKRLSVVKVAYSVPKRSSLQDTLRIMEEYLSEHSGGDRLMALSSALFSIIGRRLQLYEKVKRGKITAADKATGLVADLECASKTGKIIMGVEVKDRELTITHLRGKIPSIREKKVTEMFFVAQGISKKDKDEIQKAIAKEYASGHNIYVVNIISLSKAVLALVGEQGRREFLDEVGNQLDEYKSDIVHRRKWAELLRRF